MCGSRGDSGVSRVSVEDRLREDLGGGDSNTWCGIGVGTCSDADRMHDGEGRFPAAKER